MRKATFIKGYNISKKQIEPNISFWKKLVSKMKILIHGQCDFELSDLGDLSNYSYEDLKKHIL